MRLKDKVIIITGSTTGIGKAIALRCVEEGALVVIHGLETNWGEEVVEKIGKDKAVLVIADLASPGAYKNIVQTALQKFGKINAVVNNAAWVTSSDINSADPDYIRKVFEINSIAPLLLIKETLKYLTETRGCVLNIGSVNAWSGEPNLLAYSMSKGALMTMTRNLGDTLHREYGVRVNQVNPGWVLTETETIRKKEQGLPEDWYTKVPRVYAPAGRILLPGEIAAAAVYWLADESGPISGQVVDIEQHPFIGRNPPKDQTTMTEKN